MPNPSRPVAGWIGLGALGLPMARRAVERGWEVWGCDASPEREELARQAGVQIGAGAAAVAARADEVVACVVRDPGQVRDALISEGGALRADPRLVGVVMSSTGTEVMTELAALASAQGTTMIAAPVLGNPSLASTGDLTVVISGDPVARAIARPLLQSVARSVVDLGDEPGAAQTMKTVSQLLQIVGMVACFEGMELARGYRLREEDVLGVLGATAPSWTTAHWDYASDLWSRRNANTSLGLFAKDLGAADRDAAAAGLELPLMRAALKRMRAQLDG
jgi:3-hydroxyisobutyrate dehydrogenase-like beta-hydroxyacid dehydrogenase